MVQKSMAAALFGAANFGFALAAPAFAESIGAVTAEELETALNDAGLGPVVMLEDAASGAPVASAQAGPFKFVVRALDCSGSPPACETLMFFTNFELGRSATASDFRTINKFNDGQVFGRAYVLEAKGQVGVDYVIELGGGVSEEHLSTNIARWADVVGAFVADIEEGYSGS